LGDLRYSTGLGLQWISPFGPLRFSIAQPLRSRPEDPSRGYNSPSAPDSEEPLEATNMKPQIILLSAALLIAASRPLRRTSRRPSPGNSASSTRAHPARRRAGGQGAEENRGEFQKRDQELAHAAEQLKKMQDELEKNSVTMSETQRRVKEREFGDLNRDFQRKQREFREDLNQRRNEELAQVVEQANRIIRQIAEQDKYDIIFQDAVFASRASTSPTR